ncbi:hypothetical protein D3C84_373540 [compost metagenome]
MLVEQVVGVQSQADLLCKLVAGAGAPDGVTRYVEGVFIAQGMALGGEAQAGADSVPVAAELVIAPHPQHVLGRPGAEDLAFVGRVIEVLGGVVGVAGKQLQAGEHFTADFRVEPLAAHFARGNRAVPAVAGEARGQVVEGSVFLVVTEQRQGGVDPAVHQLALEADFVVAADHRLEHLAAGVAQCLGFEHVGVAGVHRPFAVQVIDDAGVGRDFPGFVGGAFRVGVDHVAECELAP